MLLYDGDNTYNDKPLFHGAVVNSWGLVPADPSDSPKALAVYDVVMDSAAVLLPITR